MKHTKEEILEACNAKCRNTLMETLGIEFIDITENSLIGRMPVNSRVHQPDGLLHGGASVAFAESIGSAATFVFMNADNVNIRAIEISANHVKSVTKGFVYAHASALHKGRTTQLWQIRIVNEQDELVSMVKLTTITFYN